MHVSHSIIVMCLLLMRKILLKYQFFYAVKLSDEFCERNIKIYYVVVGIHVGIRYL